MANSIHQRLLEKIIQKDKGSLLFPSEFSELGSINAIRLGLSRLAKEKLIFRLGQGIYLYPKFDSKLGMLYPSTEDIAEAIAKQDRARIIPTGAQALYKIGLSTQIPMKAVYLTDGVRRVVKIGKRTIEFKSTTPKLLSALGKSSLMAIQALKELGKDQVDDKVKKQIKKVLYNEDAAILRHDMSLAPAWIIAILISILNELEHDRMVTTNKRKETTGINPS